MKKKVPTYDLFSKNELNLIKKIDAKREGKLRFSKKAIEEINCILEADKMKYELSYSIQQVLRQNRKLLQLGRIRERIEYIPDDKDEILYLSDISINSLSLSASHDIKASVYSIQNRQFKNKSRKYHKVYIPVSDRFNFNNKLEETVYTTDLGYRSRESIKFTIDQEVIKVFLIKDKIVKPNRRYAVITSNRRLIFEEFEFRVRAIQIVLGYLISHFPGDKGYFFQYSSSVMKDKIGMRIGGLRESSDSNYRPLDVNSYGLIPRKKRLAKKYYRELQVIPSNVVSKLVKLTLQKPDMAGVLLLIIEASTSSLLQMPGSLAIALETMTRLIKEDETISTKASSSLVADRFLRKSLLNGWRNVLDEKKEELGDAYSVIMKRIDAFLVATNQDKLSVPFSKLGIDLNERDMELLDARNDFLHGRFPAVKRDVPFKGNEIRRIDLDLLYCSTKYYTLINLLILKWIGFKGKIINYPKLYEGLTGIGLNEELYREV